MLELDELLDPARLAAAWQDASARAEAPSAALVAASAGAQRTTDVAGAAEAAEAAGAAGAAGVAGAAGAAEADDAAGGAVADDAAAGQALALPPALPVAAAHRRFLEELARAFAASPALADAARGVLAVPLEQLAVALTPLDGATAEAALDAVEDLLQAVLSATGWPSSGQE